MERLELAYVGNSGFWLVDYSAEYLGKVAVSVDSHSYNRTIRIVRQEILDVATHWAVVLRVEFIDPVLVIECLFVGQILRVNWEISVTNASCCLDLKRNAIQILSAELFVSKEVGRNLISVPVLVKRNLYGCIRQFLALGGKRLSAEHLAGMISENLVNRYCDRHIFCRCIQSLELVSRSTSWAYGTEIFQRSLDCPVMDKALYCHVDAVDNLLISCSDRNCIPVIKQCLRCSVSSHACTPDGKVCRFSTELEWVWIAGINSLETALWERGVGLSAQITEAEDEIIASRCQVACGPWEIALLHAVAQVILQQFIQYFTVTLALKLGSRLYQ